MKITVIGAGYVGLVTGTCLSEVGHRVTILDIDQRKIDSLRRCIPPIYEPGLREMLRRNFDAGRLSFTADPAGALTDTDVAFIAVGTPSSENGSADLQHVLTAARAIGKNVSRRVIVVTKSTAPVGTSDKVREVILDALERRADGIEFAVVSNPEFLREGCAIGDCMHPDRIVIGSLDDFATERMRELYAPFLRRPEQFVVCDPRSAELIKYAANAMLATRISFMNEIANLAEKVGANITSIQRGLASDSRIGPHFLNAGCGYGGSCFPKDVRALLRMGEMEGQELDVVRGVDDANERQKTVIFRKLSEFFQDWGGLGGKTIAVWGLAFKPDTDDVREAPSLTLIADLERAGARVRAYDPAASETARAALDPQSSVVLCKSAMETATGADALAVVTEWAEFRMVDLHEVAERLKYRLLVDGRNIFEPCSALAARLEYRSIGR